jgi:murein DD-endopeptidase MepM/ murein hydrolase activator NlpD
VVLTLTRLVKRQARNLAVLLAISLFSFAFCHHSGVTALEVPVTATALDVMHPYYEVGRQVRVAELHALTGLAPLVSGDAPKWTLDQMIHGLNKASDHLEEKERVRFPHQALIRISSRFGMRHHPVLHRWRLHNGVDFAAPPGTPVLAVDEGVVLSAGWSGASGRLVKVDHGTYVAGYAHLSKFNVSPGQKIEAGVKLGEVGASGRATGNHLHFTIRKAGRFVDPLNDGIERLEPIVEIQMLVNIERSLGATATIVGNTAAALLHSANIELDSADFDFDDSFL